MVAKAEGISKEGTAEAEVMKLKYSSEAQGIEESECDEALRRCG